ncbi:MAG: response regulator [Candidatus Omnitrophica bacterium]|nr:response regulator [Candidatus Omnitrophota bacterium]
MYETFYQKKTAILRKSLCSFVAFAFSLSLVIAPVSRADAQYITNLPKPGEMVLLSPTFQPPVLKGMTLHPENPLQFDFIVDRGQDKLTGDALKEETQKLLKYFLAAMTIPDDDSWVNLSPYEGDRIIPDMLGSTDMGKHMLEQDYLLKQLSASLTNPQEEIGKKFWDTVYKKAYEKFGTTSIPINTFNKVWIMPDRAEILEEQGYVFIGDSHLKIMLDEDYTSIKENLKNEKLGMNKISKDKVEDVSSVSSEVVRQIILPELEKEINEGKNFASVRQIYHSVILAAWYKQNLKNSLLGKVYVDKSKINGVDISEKDLKQKIYEQYLAAFRKGVYNMIKEDYDLASKEALPRKYFSGGVLFGKAASSAIQRLAPNDPRAERLIQYIRTDMATNTGGNGVGQYTTAFVQFEEQQALQSVLEGLRAARAQGAQIANPAGLTESEASWQVARFVEKYLDKFNAEFEAKGIAQPASATADLKISPEAILATERLLLELSYQGHQTNWNGDDDRVIVFGTKGLDFKGQSNSGGIDARRIDTNLELGIDLVNLTPEGADLFIAIVADRLQNPFSGQELALYNEYWNRLVAANKVSSSAALDSTREYTLAEIRNNVMPITFSKFQDPLVRKVFGRLIRDIVEQATDDSVKELYVNQNDYIADQQSTEVFINWILNDVGKRIDVLRLAGKINPQKADWVTWDRYHTGQVPEGKEKEKVKVTFFATSGNPIQLAHIGQMLNDIANNETDFALIVLQGSDTRKPDLSPMEVRVHILQQSVLKSLAPFIQLSQINEDNLSIDGEENVLRIARMNPGLNLQLNYLFGLDHFLRTTWLRKGLAALPEIVFQKDEIRSALRLSELFTKPGTITPDENSINKVTDALVKLSTGKNAEETFDSPTSLADALVLAGVSLEDSDIIKANYAKIFGKIDLPMLLSKLKGQESAVDLELLLARDTVYTPTQIRDIAAAIASLSPEAFVTLQDFKTALSKTALRPELVDSIAEKKVLERFFNAVPILDTISRFENAKANEITIKGESETFKYPNTLNIKLVALDRAGETNSKEVQGMIPGTFEVIGVTPGFGDAAATGIREKGRFLWATQGVLFALAEETVNSKNSIIPSLSLAKAEPYLGRIKRRNYGDELIERISRNETSFKVSTEITNTIALGLTQEDITQVFETVGLSVSAEDSNVWEIVSNAASSAVRVLLAEDSPKTAFLEKRILERLGYAVTQVATAEEARAEIAKAKEQGQPFEILVLDNHFDGSPISGEQLVDEMIEAKDLTDPRVIFASDDDGTTENTVVTRVEEKRRNNPAYAALVVRVGGKIYDDAAVINLVTQKVIPPATSSAAVTVDAAPVGGIDFDPSLLNLQIKRNGKGVPLPLPQQNIENIHIDGLFPVIINMQPATIQSFPFLLSSEKQEKVPELSMR